jgi:drug/metabolite transporter (DMT)-like permease
VWALLQGLHGSLGKRSLILSYWSVNFNLINQFILTFAIFCLKIGCAMAFSCMSLGVFTVVILRYIRNVHYAFITFFYGLIGTLVSLFLCWWVDELKAPKTLEHWLYAFGVAKLTFLGQNALTLALKYEQAGPISLIRPSEIIFIFVWQFLFLNKFPDYLR